MPSRRDVLGLGSATLALLAGCVAQSPSGVDAPDSPSETAPTDSPTTPTRTGTPTPEVEVWVRDVVVTPTLVGMDSDDSIGAYGARDEQFVVAHVRGYLPLEREAFELVADGEAHAPVSPFEVTPFWALWDFEGPYERERGGFLLFSLPKPLDADAVALRWPTGDHRLSDEQVRRLELPPTTFEVRAFAAPDAVTTGTETTLTVTVENVGDADGTFVGALNRVGPLVAYAPVETVSLDVAAGESATWTHSHTPSLDGAAETRQMRFLMPWRDGEERSTTDVEPRSVTE